MPATRGSYLPTHIDERLIQPVNSCRIATLIHFVDIASLGEAVTRPNGKRLGKRAYRNLLDRMREATGIPDREGYNQGHIPQMMQAGFPRYPAVDLFNTTWDRISSSVQNGFAVSIAGQAGKSPGHTGIPAGSPLRQHTTVDHQILAVRERTREGVAHWLIYDPMVPWNPRHRGYWVPRDHVRMFADRFEVGGDYVAERVKIGGWSQVAECHRDSKAAVDAAREAQRVAEAAQKQAQKALKAVKEDLAACLANA